MHGEANITSWPYKVSDEEKEMIRRVTACLKACAGLSTELLERASESGMASLAEKSYQGANLTEVEKENVKLKLQIEILKEKLKKNEIEFDREFFGE